MALIAMAVHDTEENGKLKYTQQAVNGLMNTVDLDKHRLIIINNNSCEECEAYLNRVSDTYNVELIHMAENVGTAKAINQAWKLRRPGEHCIKMDNDVLIYCVGWVDELEQAIERDPGIGICGLKRKDLIQSPWNENEFYKSQLIMLPHKPGEDWIVVEATRDIMGTCTMFNSALLDKIGGLWQPSLYGYDDVLASYRSNLAGFVNCFLPHIRIDHIDPGGGSYQDWKHKESGRVTDEVSKIVDEYIAGTRSIYYEI